MTETIFQSLTKWVCEVLGDVEVTPLPPVSEVSGKTRVTLYFLSIEESSSTGVRPVKNKLQLFISYLVKVSGDIHNANTDILKLAFSAMASGDMEPVFNSLSLGDWRSFGVIPGPAFVIKVPVNHKISEKEIKIVEKPMILKSTLLKPE